MAGLRSVTDKYIVVKKINGFWGDVGAPNPIPKRQLILITADNAFTLTCTEEVLKRVEEYSSYRFVIDNDITQKRVKIVDVLLEDKK